MSATGATRVVTMDLHAGQIQGFFNVPVDHLMSASLLADYVKSRIWKTSPSFLQTSAVSPVQESWLTVSALRSPSLKNAVRNRALRKS